MFKQLGQCFLDIILTWLYYLTICKSKRIHEKKKKNAYCKHVSDKVKLLFFLIMLHIPQNTVTLCRDKALHKTATLQMDCFPCDALCDRILSPVTVFKSLWSPSSQSTPEMTSFVRVAAPTRSLLCPTALNIDGAVKEGWSLSYAVVWPLPIGSLFFGCNLSPFNFVPPFSNLITFATAVVIWLWLNEAVCSKYCSL